MKKILFALFLFNTVISPQAKNNTGNEDLLSPVNTKRFADYLFCQKDYLRAADEYERYLKSASDDSVEFKIAVAYSLMGNFNIADEKFNLLKKTSAFYEASRIQYLKSVFQSSDFSTYRMQYSKIKPGLSSPDTSGIACLYNYSYLFTNDALPEENKFLSVFAEEDKPQLKNFYNWKEDPPVKSALTAALLSVLIPGSGKIYSGNYADGIFAFIASLGTAYLAYDNFNAHHNLRGWIWGALSAGFYAGNIYGSVTSVQIYNARIRFDFVSRVKMFVEEKNYFLRILNFCN